MNGTPRLRSGFPSTPGTTARRQQPQDETPNTISSVSTGASVRSPSLPLAPESAPKKANTLQPVIPLTLLDAPQQRFYAIVIYAGLLIWKFFNWASVSDEGEGSWPMFFKWVVLDLIYLFALPELRIPWLEWSQSFVVCVSIVHIVMNWFLMFLVPVSYTAIHKLFLTFNSQLLSDSSALHLPSLHQGHVRARNLHFRTQRQGFQHIE